MNRRLFLCDPLYEASSMKVFVNFSVKRANSCEWTDVRPMFEIKYDIVKKKKQKQKQAQYTPF